MTDMTLM